MVVLPKNDLEYSIERLRRILSRRRLNFNPYEVPDNRLVELVDTVGWGNEYDIVQMMTVTFTRLKPAPWSARHEYEGIYMKIGNSEKEIFLPLSYLIYKVTLTSNARHIRSMIGKRPIYQEKDVVGMVGKKYFLSHTIPGVNVRQEPRVAYHFHRLHGKVAKDAAIIRRAMTESRCKMLGWMILHVNAPQFLDCRRDLFDYVSPINAVATRIYAYKDTQIPEE